MAYGTNKKILVKKKSVKPTIKVIKTASKPKTNGTIKRIVKSNNSTITPMYKNSVTGKVTKGKTKPMTFKTITEKEFNK